jgi:hypothetical protein
MYLLTTCIDFRRGGDGQHNNRDGLHSMALGRVSEHDNVLLRLYTLNVIE